ncbi:MAG: DNA-3-methyladenine glycosylase [Candidatus Bathyarchaeota archaeon]|nr:DNA-3-methyladenine glycosylase [Candidatus Bathyarchaeota archaeon]
MGILPRPFFARDVLVVAQELLGKHLTYLSKEGRLTGRIVEVEAYKGIGDPASHAYRGSTSRNAILFKGPGFAYIYFIYGVHYCLNVTTTKRGVVLIRAIEPIDGIEIMRKRRNTERFTDLTNGPGKLTRSMGITKELYGVDLTTGKELFITNPEDKEKFDIVSSKRIGINVATEKPWRFYIKGNSFVSK